MAKWGRLFVFKRNAEPPQQILVRKELTIEYNIIVFVSSAFKIIYNIIGTDARTLFSAKEPGKALWEEPDKSDPSSHNE